MSLGLSPFGRREAIEKVFYPGQVLLRWHSGFMLKLLCVDFRDS